MASYALSVDSIQPRHGSTVRISNVADPVSDRDATNKQWVQSVISAGGAPFEASNGWISGGIVSAVAGETTFNVSQMVCRFTDYTNETAPTMALAVTLGPWNNIASAYPGSNAIGINVKSDGTILQLTDPVDTSVLYGDYIHVGALIQQGGAIAAVSDSKYPVADRYALVATDFIQRLSPLNLNGNVVSASTTVTDLSIAVSEGYVWQHMSQATTSRTNPSYKYKAAVDRPAMARIWRNSVGELIFEAQNQQLDTSFYNPNGTGASLVAIPAGYWVNIPIIYSPASNSFAMQYPTRAYATKAFAESKIGIFERFDSIMRAVIVIGFTTVQESATDLLNAAFSGGEFYNYCVNRNSNNYDELYSIDYRSNIAFVDYGYGDDSTGQLNLPSSPFKTYNAAVNGITAVNSSNLSQWVVRAAGGHHVDATVSLKPNTALVGDAPRVAMFDVSADKVQLDGSFSAAAADASINSIFCCRFMNGTFVDLNLFALGSTAATSSIFDVRECGFYGNCDYHGRTLVGDQSFWVNTGIHQNWRFYGGRHWIFTAICFGTGAEEVLFDASNVDTEVECCSVHCKNLRLVGPTASNVCRATVTASHIYGTITVNGSGAHLDIDRGSLALGVVVTLLNGGTYCIYDADLTTSQIAGITSAVPAVSGGNPVATSQSLTNGLSSKVDTSRTVQGYALTANVTISASDLTTGTLPHAQLPTLLSTDIPASITSNTSGYAGSLNGVQTIPTDSTMQAAPALYDSSAKIPTTGWVYSMRGAGEGLAQLSGGKVPLSQLPDAITSGLKYEDTWDIAVDGTVYPAATVSGQFWIVTGAGTMGYPDPPTTAYDVGDWFVYDSVGALFSRVPANIPDLDTWTGNTYIASVGTITAGAWNASMIDTTRGGAGTLTGLLKGNGGAPVTVASTSSDYVAPSGASTINGEKTFSGGLYSTAALDWTATGSAVANASYVSDVALYPQDQLIYVSKVGNDAWDGKTLRSAVSTINQAVFLAINNGTALTAAYQFGIVCLDAANNTDVTLPQFVAVQADNMRIIGTTQVASYTKLSCRRLDTPSIGNTLLRYSGVTPGLGVAYVSCFRLLPGAIVVDANMGVCDLQTGIVDGLPGTDLSYDVASGSTLYIQAVKISGIARVADGGTLDLRDVNEFGTFSVATAPSYQGTVLWPANGAGNVTGILKCDGFGTVTAALPGTDYLLTNQTITLGSDLSGSGSTTLNATIANAAVTFAKMANLAATSVIANPTGSATVPQAVTMTSGLSANSVALRDASVNCRFNHATESYATTNADVILNVNSAKIVEITGVTFKRVTLPNATTLPLGFNFQVINSATTTIDVCKSDGSTVVLSLEEGVHSSFIVTDIGTSNGSWSYARANQYITLTGDVTGSGRSPLTTALAAVPLTKLAAIAADSLVGNPTGGAAVPTTVSSLITMTGDVSWTGRPGTSTAATIPASSISFAKLNQIGAGRLIGNLGGTTTNPGTVGASLTINGDISWTGTIGQTSGATISDGAVSLSKFAPLPAFTFIGNPGPTPNATYLNINITMGGDVLWSGQPGANTNATIPPNSITFPKIQQIAAGRLIGNVTANTTNPGTVTATVAMTGDVAWSSTIGSSAAATINNNVVSLGKIQQVGALQLLGNATTSSPVNVATVPMSALATGGAVCLRDASGNAYFNNAAVNSTSIATAAATTALAASSPGSIVFTGTTTQTVTLPDATTVPRGWTVRLFNDSTGAITVNSSTNSPVSVLTGGMSGVFVSSATTPAAGEWRAGISSRWPTPLYTNSMTTPLNVVGGSNVTLSAADIYNGPRALSKTGNGLGTFVFPAATTMLAYISTQAGIGTTGSGLIPPVGFSWTALLYVSAVSGANGVVASAGTGVTFYPTTAPTLAVNQCYDCKCWVTSTTTYAVLFVRMTA